MLRYHNHLEEFSKTGSIDNYKMACLELRMASSRLNHKLNKLEANSFKQQIFPGKGKNHEYACRWMQALRALADNAQLRKRTAKKYFYLTFSKAYLPKLFR